jgi:ABC-type transport system involved in cytochrome bd biosynthesis fused ATPase/permease subunit
MELEKFTLATLPRAIIRSRMTVLPQDASCIPGSVYANLDPHGRCSQEAISDALTKVGLFELIEERGGIEGSISNPKLFLG